MSKRIPPQDYHDLAQERGFEWLEPYTGRVTDKTRWRCPEGHEWDALYDSVRRGSGCPKCAGRLHLVKWPSSEIMAIYTEANVELLESLPKKTTDTPLTKCLECKHKWNPYFFDLQQGAGCPKCAGQIPINQRSANEIMAIYDRANVKLLGALPKNSADTPLVKCLECGHKWSPRYYNMYSGKGCPKCAGSIYKGETRMLEVCEIWSIRKESQKTFDECKDKTYLPFDLFVPHIGKEHNGFLFEFQGRQHYEPVNFTGNATLEKLQTEFEITQYHDKLKRLFVTEYNFRLRAIHYEEFDKIEAIILEAVGEENVGLANQPPKPSKHMGVEIGPIVGRQLKFEIGG